MYVMIKNCKDKENCWYVNKINNLYEVLQELKNSYLVRTENNGRGVVLKEDCEVMR